MRKYLALFIALFVTLSTAGYVAQLAGSSLDMGAARKLFPAGSVTTEGILYSGNFGDYSVSASESEGAVYVVISGEQEEVFYLGTELFWLTDKGILSTSCREYGIFSVTESGYESCNGTLLVFYCPSCELSAPASEAPVPAKEAGAASLPPQPQEALSTQGEDAQEAPPGATRAMDLQIGATNEKAASAGGDQPSAPLSGINGEQILQLLAAFIAVVVASYLILQSRQETVQMDPQVDRLLSNHTRAGIMNELSVADKIPTDLSRRLKKSKASIVEHLAELSSAGLVEKLETPGRKFVYYRLTQKGRQALLRRAA